MSKCSELIGNLYTMYNNVHTTYTYVHVDSHLKS